MKNPPSGELMSLVSRSIDVDPFLHSSVEKCLCLACFKTFTQIDEASSGRRKILQ